MRTQNPGLTPANPVQQWSSNKVTNRVWVMGDAVVDLIPEGEQHYLKCPGGAPANVAVGLPLSDATKNAWANPNNKPKEDYNK